MTGLGLKGRSAAELSSLGDLVIISEALPVPLVCVYFEKAAATAGLPLSPLLRTSSVLPHFLVLTVAQAEPNQKFVLTERSACVRLYERAFHTASQAQSMLTRSFCDGSVSGQ